MVENRRLASNALANVLQTLASAGLLFALYRYINTTLGVEQLGVWSVVLATVSASRLADLGLSSGVIRFVARYRASGEPRRASQVVDTALLTLMAPVGIVLPLLYPLISGLLPHLFEATYLAQARAILPYALVSLWLTIMASVSQSGLDGCQRMDLSAGVVVVGQALLLGFAIWLVPRHGLIGLVWAQIGQGVFIAMAGRLLLHRVLPTLPLLPRRWNKHVLREMIGYGANVQTANLFAFLLTPVAKALLARFGGPAAAGYFEIANQVVVKTRGVIVTANRAVVPHVTAIAETEPIRLASLYRENVRALVFITLPTFALLFAWSGGISWLFVGAYEHDLVFLIGLVAIAWAGNVFAGPAYFTNLGTGHVSWNTISHAIMAGLNVGLGWLLGSLYGAHGVAFAYAIAIITGSGMLTAVFQWRSGLGWRVGFAREHLGLAVACSAVAAFGWIQPLRPSTSEPVAIAAGLILPPLILGLFAWFHPMRRRLWVWLTTR